MPLITTETHVDRPLRIGSAVHANAISGANIIRDLRETITNTIGGQMTRYEALLDQTISRALEALESKASEQGYDGVIGVRVSHPTITTGAVCVVVYGTGFNYA
jgi:uncharacterized protein YbjQ (UPF0145 family)